MMFNDELIAGFVYDLIKYEKVCQKDLEFSFSVFKKMEEYEKCSIIKELLELKYYDNRKRNNTESILNVERILVSISTGAFFMNRKDFLKQGKKIKRFNEDVQRFYNMIEDTSISKVMPPFKNKNNIKYFIER